MSAANPAEPVSFTPTLRVSDPTAGYWLRQVTVRLRREVSWRWFQQGAAPPTPAALPAPTDPLAHSLDLLRHDAAKRAFFAEDVTAAYLTDNLAAPRPAPGGARGSFGWVIEALALDDASCFLLALALGPAFDPAAGPVIAACANDGTKPYPTLALAQQLWADAEPDAVLAVADASHALWRYGLLQSIGAAEGPGSIVDWAAPYAVPALIARSLYAPGGALPGALQTLDDDEGAALVLAPSADALAQRLALPATGLRVVPVRGRARAPYADAVAALSSRRGRTVCRVDVAPEQLADRAYTRALVALAWLRDVDLFFDHAHHEPPGHGEGERHGASHPLSAARAVPTTIFVSVEERAKIGGGLSDRLLPALDVPTPDHATRVAEWRRGLGARAWPLDDAVAECARRYRFELPMIRSICRALMTADEPVDEATLRAACRAEVPLHAGELAQRVIPRFSEDDLVLPRAQRQQFRDICDAMRALTDVHYRWGTARAWNESGISVLFAGPPGTGKTMAAEVIAAQLDIPMFRIDLSQVVNKYIGETEKNLKRLFDLADVADCILFFDEADALFGRRTQVKDAHDRYANLEVSYLLERMERCKGLAILATNRRKDLDEAFLRRLRYVVEFPLPAQAERRAIWQRAIPPHVDASAVDLDFLAWRFPLAGGNIRSIVFNACLAASASDTQARSRGVLTMEHMIVALKREYDKLQRSVSPQQFGAYAPLVKSLEDGS